MEAFAIPDPEAHKTTKSMHGPQHKYAFINRLHFILFNVQMRSMSTTYLPFTVEKQGYQLTLRMGAYEEPNQLSAIH